MKDAIINKPYPIRNNAVIKFKKSNAPGLVVFYNAMIFYLLLREEGVGIVISLLMKQMLSMIMQLKHWHVFYSIHFIKIFIMLKWAVIFIVIAIIAAIFGFTGIAAGAASIAKVLFFIFIVLFLLTLIFGAKLFGK